MKKLSLICYVVLIAGLAAGCSDGSNIADKPRNYTYAMGEPIEIYDVNTGDLAATLVMTSAQTLKDEAFTITEQIGTDEEDEPVYEEVTYEELVQINYTYDPEPGGRRRMTSLNFIVMDEKQELSSSDHNMDDLAQKVDGEEYITVALKNKSDEINIIYNYGKYLQLRHTAKIKMAKSDVFKEQIDKIQGD